MTRMEFVKPRRVHMNEDSFRMGVARVPVGFYCAFDDSLDLPDGKLAAMKLWSVLRLSAPASPPVRLARLAWSHRCASP